MTKQTPPPYLAARDYGHGEWDAIGVAHDKAGAMDLITEAFKGETMAADLGSVAVIFRNDAGLRDVTEDILIAIGAHLSSIHTAETFPDAFADWANSDIQDSLAEMVARDWANEQNALNRRDAA